MKRYLKKLLVCTALAFAGNESTFCNTAGIIGKTTAAYYSPDSVGKAPYFGGGGYNTLDTECKDRENCMGGCFSMVWGADILWKDSDKGPGRIAQRFGIEGLNKFTIEKLDAAKAGSIEVRDFLNLKDLPGTAGTPKYPSAIVSFNPDMKRFLGMLCYKHSLSSFYDGLAIGFSLPFVYMKTELNASYDSIQAAVPGTGGTVSSVKNVQEFFEGKGGSDSSVAPQAGLKYLVWENSDAKTTLQNIPLWLSLRVVDGENFRASIAAVVQIPLSSQELDLKKLFEPRVSVRNFRTGAAVCMDMCLVEGADYKVGLDAHGQWLYAWSRKGQRAPIGTKNAYDHYKLVIGGANSAINTPTPLINVFLENGTTSVTVKPKHNFEAAACLSAEKGCFVADLRYAFQGQSEEKNDVEMKSLGDLYYIKSAYTVNENVANNASLKKVETGDFNWNLQSSYTHYVGVGLGCVFKDTQYPAAINFSLGYKFGQNGSTDRNPDMWVLAIKGAICF